MDYCPGPTGANFLASRAFLKLVMGPVGGGKSTVCLADLFARACFQEPYRNVRRTKFCIMRNTVAQLKDTVKPLINQWFVTLPAAPMGTWRLSENVFEIKANLQDGTILHTEFCLLAADTPDDVRRLLSVEFSAGWVEECREFDSEVFTVFQTRVARFPNMAAGGVTYPGLICSTNPPPMGTYWQELIANPPKNMEVFVQPPAMLDDGSLNPDAENIANLHADYYTNLMEGKTDGWIDVYLKNKFGAGGFGMPVFKSTFRLAFHVSKTELRAIPGSNNPIIVGMDNGLTAAAVIGQMDAKGRLNIMSECYVPEGVTMGVETFLDKMLVPHLVNTYQTHAANIRFVLDPACFHRAQLDERTIADAVAARGYQVTKASTNDPERRIAAVEGLLMRAIDGGAGMLVSPKCPWLTKALDWGYRNKKQANGVTSATPDKNHYSHTADALQYLCLHYNIQGRPMGVMKRTAQVIQPRAYSYT